VPFKHKYIVYTDSEGNEWATRGGPGYFGPGAEEGLSVPSSSEIFGNITTSNGPYDENHPDWDTQGDDPRETILEGEDLSQYWQALKDAMDDIEAEGYPYTPLQNSNTAIDEALRRSGLQEPQLDDPLENWSPGSGRPLTWEGGIPRDDEVPGSWSEPFESASGVYPPMSPLVLDLDGDGTESVSVTAGAYFDHNADGFSEATGWAGPNDGLLVWDRNADGRIGSGRELFGTQTLLQNGQLAANGFVALAEWDANTDGKIDPSDPIWADLKIWVDDDGDGFSAADEFLSLGDAGVASINLGYANGPGLDAAGNEEWLTGSFTRADASTGVVTDYRFVRDTKLTIPEEWLEIPTVVGELPAVKGFGTVYDLHQAMIRDSTGALRTLVEDFAVQSATAARNALLEQIVLKWTGAESVDPESRGSYIDARHLVALEAFMGREFIDVYGLPNPNQNAAALLNTAYTNLSKSVYAQLMAQTHLGYLYDQIAYSWNEGLQGDLSALQAYFNSNISSDDGITLLHAAEFVRTVMDLGVADALGLSTLQSIPELAGLISGSSEILGGGVGGDILTGGVQADVVVGLAGDDSINTSDGDDIVHGGDGNDTIQSGNGNDLVYAGAGDDTVTDTAGWDTIYGGDGNDTISGASQFYGQYTIYGEAGDDVITVAGGGWPIEQQTYTQTLSGGTGNDTITGSLGYNIYLYGRGDGADTIYDYSQYARDDKIVLGTGIALQDLTARRVGYSLELRIADPGNPSADDRITINNWFQGANYQIETVEFADASVLTATQLSVMGAHVYGTEGNDTLTGFTSSDTLHGLGGNDTISDPSGNETIYAGDGDDAITVSTQGWGSNWVYGEAGNDTISVGGGSWTQPGQQIDQTQHLWGGAGNDMMYGGIGYNVYHFDRGDGADTIHDYAPYARDDKIVLGAGIALEDVSARRVGYGLELRIADPGNPGADDRITINNWFSHAYYQVERVEFADASVLTAAQLTSMAAIVTGTEGNDSITGWDGNETYYGLGGNDTIYSGNGNDIVYGGAGDDTINDIAGWDTIYGEDGNDTIIVSSYYWGSTTVYGGAGNDVITVPYTQWPYNQAPMTHNFTGGLGNDTFNGGIGNTIYHYARGDGADTITDNSYGYAGTDKIVFAAGIAIGDVSAQAIGYDLQLRIADPANPAADDRITVKNWYDPYVPDRYRIERIEFADGTVVLSADVQAGDANANTLTASANASLLSGGGGNDTLNGGAASDSIYGGTGNDVITGGGGDDAIHGDDGDDDASAGDGNDVVYGDAGVDTVSGGSGDDYVSGGSEGDTVNGDDGTDVLQGGTGDDQVSGGLGNDLVSGDEGNDVLDGGDGNDLLAGGAGNDTINTGAGSNIIAYNAGGGIDTVYAAAGASNTLSFGGGIGYDDLSLSKDGNDLIVSVGPDGQVVFKDWYAGSNGALNLQIIHDASDEFDANSTDPLYNKKVQTFDFAGLVAEFDDALAQSPGLTSWAVTNALLEFHLSGSDDAAIGGDLAYWYGKNAGFTGIGLQSAQAVLGAPGFGSDAQTLQPFSGLQEGFVKLA
jgi:Ca2+-binding RTX toxin-like protein